MSVLERGNKVRAPMRQLVAVASSMQSSTYGRPRNIWWSCRLPQNAARLRSNYRVHLLP